MVEDLEGKKYGGITLDWDYTKVQVHLSMPEDVNDYLTRFQHKLQKLTNQPHKHTIIVFCATIKYEKVADMSTKLDDNGKKCIQQVTSTFLYYARAVDPKMMV